MPNEITDQMLRDIMPNLSAAKRQLYLPRLNEAMREFEISTYLRASAFLAQLAHESAELRYFQELASGAAYEGRRDLGNTHPGDGRKFKGHGPIQITGRANHEACGRALGLDLVNNPLLITEPENAFRSSGWFWDTRHLNDLADQRKFKEITRRINGGYNGLADRQKYYERALRVVPEDLDMTGGGLNLLVDSGDSDVEPAVIAAASAATAAAGVGANGGGAAASFAAQPQSFAAQPQQSFAQAGFAQPGFDQSFAQPQAPAGTETQTTAVVQPGPDILSVIQAPRTDKLKSLWALVVGSPAVAGVAGAFKYFTQDNSLTRTVIICITILIALFMLRQLILGFKRESQLGDIIKGRLTRP